MNVEDLAALGAVLGDEIVLTRLGDGCGVFLDLFRVLYDLELGDGQFKHLFGGVFVLGQGGLVETNDFGLQVDQDNAEGRLLEEGFELLPKDASLGPLLKIMVGAG